MAREIGDYLGEGKVYSTFSLIYLALGEGKQAYEYAEHALQILRAVRDRGMEGRTLYNRAQACALLEKKEEAFKSYKEALDIFTEIKDRWREGEALFEIGKIYYEQKRYEVALSSFLLAKNILVELQNPHRDEARVWIEKTQNELGEDNYSALLAFVEHQAQQIVDQALNAGMDNASEASELKNEQV